MPVGPGSVWVFDEHVIGAELTPLEGQSPADAPTTRDMPCSADCPEPAGHERLLMADCRSLFPQAQRLHDAALLPSVRA